MHGITFEAIFTLLWITSCRIKGISYSWSDLYSSVSWLCNEINLSTLIQDRCTVFPNHIKETHEVGWWNPKHITRTSETALPALRDLPCKENARLLLLPSSGRKLVCEVIPGLPVGKWWLWSIIHAACFSLWIDSVSCVFLLPSSGWFFPFNVALSWCLFRYLGRQPTENNKTESML